MVSSTACLKSAFEPWRRWLLLLFFLPALAWTAEIEIANAQLQASDESYQLNADFRFELNPRLEEAVNRGLTLYFVADFQLTQGRWYWFDERLVSRSLTYRLYYHALTRQYRLSTGGLHQSFSSLEDAVRVMSRLRNWPVIEAGDKVQAGESYDAALRLRLDISQLPRPFQISALASKDWDFASDWKVWRQVLPVLEKR